MFREFKVEDLFDTHVVSKKLTKASFSHEGFIPVYSSDTRNNGVLGYTEEKPTFIIDKVHPTCVIFGDHTRTINIVHDSFCVMDNVKVLSPKLNLSDEALLYIKTVWLKGIPVLGYARHWSDAKNVALSLPIQVDVHGEPLLDDDGNFVPDWDYMEARIRELEEARIRELEAYLQETGLDNYELTDSERSLLEVEPTFGEFKVGELFDVTGNKQVKSQKNIVESSNGIPFVVQSTKNNMVKCHVDRERLLAGGETVYDGNAIVLGVVSPVASYQEYEFGASQSISLRADFLNPIRGMYFVTAIKKVIESKYSYTNLPGIEKYKNDVIQLPLKPGTDETNYSEDDIDWDYMEATIRAMEKQVITDVVDYKDAVIAKTKELVN